MPSTIRLIAARCWLCRDHQSVFCSAVPDISMLSFIVVGVPTSTPRSELPPSWLWSRITWIARPINVCSVSGVVCIGVIR